jgi:hypothetical protein
MALFRDVVCPVSGKQMELNASRMTVLVCAALLAVYVLTGNLVLVCIVAADYFIRAIGQGRYSPIRWMSATILNAAGVQPRMVDQAPKLFASRVGFMFAGLSVLLFPISLPASMVLAGILCLFAFLDGAFNFCVGCLTYHYVVFPLLGNRPKDSPSST